MTVSDTHMMIIQVLAAGPLLVAILDWLIKGQAR